MPGALHQPEMGKILLCQMPRCGSQSSQKTEYKMSAYRHIPTVIRSRTYTIPGYSGQVIDVVVTVMDGGSFTAWRQIYQVSTSGGATSLLHQSVPGTERWATELMRLVPAPRVLQNIAKDRVKRNGQEVQA